MLILKRVSQKKPFFNLNYSPKLKLMLPKLLDMKKKPKKLLCKNKSKKKKRKRRKIRKKRQKLWMKIQTRKKRKKKLKKINI